MKKELADKPGSVGDNHSSGTAVASCLVRPTRIQRGPRQRIPIWSCSGWGLPSRHLLPDSAVRSYRTLSPLLRDRQNKRFLEVYSLLHFPWARAPQALPGTLSCGARTFLQRNRSGFASDCLANSTGETTGLNRDALVWFAILQLGIEIGPSLTSKLCSHSGSLCRRQLFCQRRQ